MFNKKAKLIKSLSEEIARLNRQLYHNEKDNIKDFIGILEQIQGTNNEKLQWKQRQTTINNAIVLAIENYRNKIVDLDIDNLDI